MPCSSMPKNQICITKGASFSFQKPYGSTQRLNNWGNQYMMANYPGWVVNWINANGGLSNNLMRMNYSYAAKHLPACLKGEKKQHMASNKNGRDRQGTADHPIPVAGHLPGEASARLARRLLLDPLGLVQLQLQLLLGVLL